MTPAASSKTSSVDAFVSKSAWQFCISLHSLTTPGALEAGGFVRLTSITRTNSSAHLQFTIFRNGKIRASLPRLLQRGVVAQIWIRNGAEER